MTGSSSDPLHGLPQPKKSSQRSPLNTPSEPGGERWWLKESLGPEDSPSEKEDIADSALEQSSEPEERAEVLEELANENDGGVSSIDQSLHDSTDHPTTSATSFDTDEVTTSDSSSVFPIIAIGTATVVLWLLMGKVWGIGVGLALGGGYLFKGKAQDKT